MKSFRLKTIAISVSAALLGQPAHAVLERMGPIDPANGFPRWYQDTSGLSIELCLPQNAAELAGGQCLLLPADVPVVPEVFPSAFFDEHFWWAAGANLTTPAGAKAVLTLALEAAFGAGVVPGGQIVFTRIRVKLLPIPASGTYRFIHPYGEESIEGVAGDRIFFTDDVGIGAAGDFTAAMTGRVGPFLLPSLAAGGAEIAAIPGPVPGKLYIADPARLGPVTGSPLPPFVDSQGQVRNHNIFRIEGPVGSNLGGPGIDFIETTDFSLMGRVYTGQMPSRVTLDRASYARTAAEQRVDVFATAAPTAASRLPAGTRPAAVAPVMSFFDTPCATILDATGKFIAYTQPVGAFETTMAAQGSWRWGQIRPTTALPASVCLKDNSAVDVNGLPIPAYHQLPVKDEVKVTEANYDPVTATLTVVAASSDEASPPALTLTDFTPAPTLTGGAVTVPNVLAPPARIHVLSAAAGLGEANVTTNAGGPPTGPINVVAANDSATTNEDTPVAIPVITGDTLNNIQINPLVTPVTLAIVTPPTKGSAVPNNANGTVTYTPNLNTNGTDSFTYTVTASGVTSNPATVLVNVTPVNDAPVGNADTASGNINTPITINVLANDSDVDGDTLSILAGSVTPPAGPAGSTSSAVISGTSVSFSGNSVGTYRFTYRASDGVAASAPVQVTVTLGSPETIVANPVEYITSKSTWNVVGSTSNATAHTLTLRLAGSVAGVPCNANGREIGTTTNTGNTFRFAIANATGLLDPRTTNCNAVRVESSLGGASLNTAIRLK